MNLRAYLLKGARVMLYTDASRTRDASEDNP